MSDLIDRQKAIDALHNAYKSCSTFDIIDLHNLAVQTLALRALPSAEPQERKTEKALRLLLEWAIECDFGYDNIPEEYEKYKDDIEGMSYTDGLIYIARMEVDKK